VPAAPRPNPSPSRLRRKIEIADLTPGTVHTFQVRAIGGANGNNAWSEPVSHMAT
jgi:hypothetical protein